MKFNPDIHHRKSLRLKHFNYSNVSAYFVTVCIQHKECLLGSIINSNNYLSPAGELIQNEWSSLYLRFPQITLDISVVMPNHFHAIIFIKENNTAQLGEIIRVFKSISAIKANQLLNRSGQPFWQRNYWERIIRNEQELDSLREYITNNPLQWEMDSLYSM